MVTKTITYTNYNGEQKTATYHFNLNKLEITELEYSKQGGLSDYAKKIIAAEDTGKLIELFKDLLDRSYGIKSEDGEHFRKSLEILEDFKTTEAYSEIYMELATNSKSASEFINHLVPSDLVAEAKKNPEYLETMQRLEASDGENNER